MFCTKRRTGRWVRSLISSLFFFDQKNGSEIEIILFRTRQCLEDTNHLRSQSTRSTDWINLQTLNSFTDNRVVYSIDSVDVLMKQVQTMSSSPFGALKLVQTKRDHKKFMTIDYVLSLIRLCIKLSSYLMILDSSPFFLHSQYHLHKHIQMRNTVCVCGFSFDLILKTLE